MALKRATKSIPLSGGIVEEVDDFLLEPAGMQYVENGRFTKKDLVEKGRPWVVAGGATGYSNYTVDLNGFWSDGDQRAALIGNNEVVSTSNAGVTWTANTMDHDLLGMERVLALAEQPGGMNYSCAPMGTHTGSAFAIGAWMVCFERASVDGVSNDREVVMQTYDNDTGHLIDEQVVNNACAPQALAGGGVSGAGYCYYVNTTNGNLVGYGTPLSGIGWNLVYNVGKDVQLYCGYNNRSDERLDARNYGDLRMGHSWQMHDNNGCYIAYWDPENYLGNIVYKAEATGEMKIQLMSSAVPSGTEYTITVDIPSLTTVAPLDTFSDSSYVYVLYGVFNNVGNTWDLRCTQWDKGTTASIHTYTIENDLDEVFVNGSIRKADDGDIYIAWTSANGFPTQGMQHTIGQHRVKWERVSGGDWSSAAPAIQRTESIYGHRLISNIACDKDSEAGIVVQQWNNWNPSDDYQAGTDQNAYTPLLAGKKPVTSILLGIGQTVDNSVIATFDAGQSKAVPFSTDEQSIHKGGNLWYFSNGSPGGDDYNRWHYGNRITLVEEDSQFWMDRTAAPAWVSAADPQAGARGKYVEGISRFAVYHVNSAIDVHTAPFPDGLIIGASVPCWYDAKGETIMSAGPLDSPEIVSVRATGGTDGATYNAYADLIVGSEDAKVYTAVFVFSDSSGRVHRSAPSIPVYVGRMDATQTTTTDVQVHVSNPIMVQRERGALFVEIYESAPGGTPQLAQTEQIPPTNLAGGITIPVSVPSNDNPSGAHPRNLLDTRSSKALYTAGNVLAADPWPNFTAIVSSGRRLFAQAIGDPSTIYYSKTFEQNISPEFSASLVITLGNQEITALGAIDDKVIAWTATGMWLIYGTGPDNTGANGDFFVEKMTHNLGCTDQRSVVTYQDGIAFYSNTTEEYHVLGRDLQLVDIGEAVKGLSERVVTTYGALVDAAQHELHWYVDLTVGTEYLPAGGTASPVQPSRPWQESVVDFHEAVLVYSFKYGKWCVRTMGEAFSNGIVKGGMNIVAGVPAVLSQSYVFWTQQEALWDAAELMKWETPWIKINQLQDFGRFYGATFLGKYQSSWTDNGSGTEAGDLQVTVKYDYEGSAGSTDVVRFRANKDFNPANGDNLQFEVRPGRQKCQAIKFVIEEIATEAVEVWEPTYTTGRGYVLTGVDLHYGAKGGSSRLSAGRKK